MAARAKVIVAAGSAQARLGAELRRLRIAAGLSLAGLGADVHCSGDLLRRVETTERFPSLDLLQACDAVLGTGGSLAALWPAAQAERQRRKGGATPRGKHMPLPVRFAPETSEGLITAWASASAVAPTPLAATGVRVGQQELSVARDTLAMFRQLDHVHGAGVFAAQLAVYVDTELAGLLGRPAASDEVAMLRAQLAAEFLELAGYQAVDAGRPGWAQAYYQQALVQAQASADRGYDAYLVAVNLGHLALHCEHPQTALNWAGAASAVVGTAGSPATRAAIAAVSARSYARLQDEQAATALLLKAEALLDAADPEDEPGWIRYFNRAYLADEAAHCLQDLGHAPAARVSVADALDGVGPDRVRRLTIDAALLASSWLRSGDLDQACAVGVEAVGYAARTSSGRGVERIARLLAELEPYSDHRGVRELNEYVREVLPSATQKVPEAAFNASRP